jgi:hypothetical protein
MNTMNRCLTAPQHRFFLQLAALMVSVCCWLPQSSTAQSLVRQFPAAALRGMMQVTSPPEILMNGMAARLSPGARIKGPNNLIVMSGTLVGQAVLVNYLRDTQGMVHEVWLLNAQEAQEKRAGMEPVTNFTFASEADKPKTDDGKTPYNQLPSFPQR